MKTFKFCFMTFFALALLAGALGAQAQEKEQNAKKLLVFIVAEDEYQADQTIPQFAKMMSEKYGFRVGVSVERPGNKDPKRRIIPSKKKMQEADLVIVYVRRRPVTPDQMKILRDYVASGKPLVGIRTASHAFSLKDAKPVEGLEQWPTFDKDVLGCFYQNHYGKIPGGADVTVNPEKKSHPILTGVPEKFNSPSWLYMIKPLEPTAEALMMGKVAGKDAEPVLITNTTKQGGRVVYTTLGHQDDFKIPAFERILVNSIFWALKMDVPK